MLLAQADDQTDCEKSRIVYFLNPLAAPTIFRPARFWNGVDVQIGGGVRVGDAFQAIVGPKSIAIWVTVELCRNFSEAGQVCLVGFEQEKQTSVAGIVDEADPLGRVWLNGLEMASRLNVRSVNADLGTYVSGQLAGAPPR